MIAGSGDQMPVHSVVIRNVYSRGSAAENGIAPDILHAASVAMGRDGWPDPGFAAIVCKKATPVLRCIFCKVPAYDDQLLTSMECIVIFHRDRICAGGGRSLDDGEVDSLIADKEPGMGAAAYEAGFIPVQVADIGSAGGEASFTGIGFW